MANGNAPQIDFDNAKQQATNLHDTLMALFKQFGTSGLIADFVASAAGGLFFIVALLILPIMQVVIAIGSFIAGSFLSTLDDAKQEQAEDLNNLLADTINEMLGTKLTGSQLSGGSGSASDMQNNQAIGDSILGIFEQTFGGGGPVSPQQGADNARKFAGFGINFAASQGFLSILTEAASIGFLKEFHELPDGLMRALGLARLQRLALQPLIHAAIQQPYQKYCMSQYRPTELAEAQLIKALRAGVIDEPTVRQALAEKGYPDDSIDFLLTDLSVKLGLGELVTLLNNEDVTEQDVINNLTLAGMPEDQARLQLQASDLAAAKTQVDALLAEIEAAYVGGFIDEATYNAQLSKLPLSGEQEQAFRAKVGFRQETPHAHLSFADVKTALVDNIVDFSYLDTWFSTSGYDSQSQLILTFQVLEAIKKAEQKVEFAKYRAQVLRAANKPVPPWITAAESTT